jgi:hypothetical protein
VHRSDGCESNTKADNSISVRHFDIGRSHARAVSEQGVAGDTAHGLALVGMVRDLAPADLIAVRTGIGGELRRLYSELLT